MIAGTIVMADATIQFINSPEGLFSKLTVCDTVTGISASIEVKAADLAKGLGLALDPEGGDTSDMTEEEYEEFVARLTPYSELSEGYEVSPLRWLP
jgi:hypothetical protein